MDSSSLKIFATAILHINFTPRVSIFSSDISYLLQNMSILDQIVLKCSLPKRFLVVNTAAATGKSLDLGSKRMNKSYHQHCWKHQ